MQSVGNHALPVNSYSYDSNHSGVSWSAVLAGAAAAIVLSLVLFILGIGLGLSSISPWKNLGADASTLGWSAIAWIAFTQIAASGLGGYLAGRLRVKWTQLHDDEVYFRDTAHGFLTWAFASLLMVAVFGSATTTIASGVAKAGAAATGAVAATAAPVVASAADSGDASTGQKTTIDYYIDNLFRNNQASSNQAPIEPALDAAERNEVARIFAHALSVGEFSAEDKTYLGQLIARRTGMGAAEAEARVNTIYEQTRTALEQAKTKAQQAADAARKATAYAALWMFVVLLSGAFVGSISATWGGKQRDSFSAVI